MATPRISYYGELPTAPPYQQQEERERQERASRLDTDRIRFQPKPAYRTPQPGYKAPWLIEAEQVRRQQAMQPPPTQRISFIPQIPGMIERPSPRSPYNYANTWRYPQPQRYSYMGMEFGDGEQPRPRPTYPDSFRYDYSGEGKPRYMPTFYPQPFGGIDLRDPGIGEPTLLPDARPPLDETPYWGGYTPWYGGGGGGGGSVESSRYFLTSLTKWRI